MVWAIVTAQELLARGHSLFQVREKYDTLLPNSYFASYGNCIPDLFSRSVMSREVGASGYLSAVEMCFTQTFQFISGDAWISVGGTRPIKETPPYRALRIALQVVIFHLQMDSGKSCWIELSHTVCCKEHDALAIFHRAEEQRDDAIADYILGGTFLEKHICLVEQQDCIPMSRKLEDLEELALEPICVGKQVSGRYLEMLEEVKYRTCPHTEYIGFWRCSAIASTVSVFPTPGLPLELHVSTYQKTTIGVSYCKSTMTPRPFPSTKSSNS
jgi:hypothetical protein